MTQYHPGTVDPARPARNSARLAVIALVMLGACAAWGQSPPAAPAKAASAAKAGPKLAALPVLSSPAWLELTPAQQHALKPLQATWPTLTAAHKRKWLALAQTYPAMPAPEQARVHTRMTEWVALSPRQRAEARLNFAEMQKHPPDDRKAKWQAYQALSPEEKQQLAAGAKPKPKGAAPAVKPVPSQKLAVVPPATGKAGQKQHPAIAGASGKLDHNTLLPAPVPSPPDAPVQSN